MQKKMRNNVKHEYVSLCGSKPGCKAVMTKTQKCRFSATGRWQSQESFEISKSGKKNQVTDFTQKVNYHPQVNLNNSNSNSNKTFSTIAPKEQNVQVSKQQSLELSEVPTFKNKDLKKVLQVIKLS